MSTKSKARKKAREWMSKEIETRKVIAARARREGQEDMRRDGRTLFPSKQKTYNNAEGGIDVSSVIETFPSPYGGVPNFRVPFPHVSSLSRDWAYAAHLPEREQFLEFRPVEHAFRKRIGNSSVELRWFAWEPNHGNKELEEHTSALFHGMGKLGYVQRVIDMIANSWAPGLTTCLNCGERSPAHTHYAELTRAKELLTECVDELRLRLGKLAPKQELSEREEDYRFGHRMDFAGRRL
jgi:hypothetical protein